LVIDERVPPFATKPNEPFNRQDAVAIALGEWRLFGQPVDDRDPKDVPPAGPQSKPERQPGLWERIGEYWWVGQDPGEREAAWTGKHDSDGNVFSFTVDGDYAWSAAFISYVMRVAGAGSRFFYAPNHGTYINAAVEGVSPSVKACAPNICAPKPGDIICVGRDKSASFRFQDLPTAALFPAHCGIVVTTQPGVISIIAGNVDDAVTLTHVPVTADGTLAQPDGTIVDTRYPWLVVLQVVYDAEAEPASDE